MPPLERSTREEPRDRRIAHAIQGFHSEAVTALREMKRAISRALELPTRLAEADPIVEFGGEAQRTFNRAVDIFLETMAGRDRSRLGFTNAAAESGLIEKWDRFAHGVGVKMGYEAVGATASAQAPGVNEAAVQAFMGSAFDRLSENGQMRLERVRDEIREIIEHGVSESISPLDLARDLTGRFDQYERYEFERLARTEVAFAQVDGELAEFEAQGVDTSGVSSDPPPWHPHCLCDLSIQPAEGGGWIAVYEVSAQACELCQEYARG